MNLLQTVKAGLKNGSRFYKANEPLIMTWLGVFGIWLTGGLAAYETPEFLAALEQEGLDDPEIRKERWLDTGKVVLKSYYPAIISGAATTLCITHSNHESAKRESAAIAMAQMSAQQLKEIRDKIIEEQGEKKLKELDNKIAQDHMDKNPPTPENTTKNGTGLSLCREPVTGQYFYTNYKAVYDAADEMRKLLWPGDFVPFSEWLWQIAPSIIRNLPSDQRAKYEDIGWQKTSINDTFSISFGECRDPDGEPCNEIIYYRNPDATLSDWSFRY